MWPTGRNTGMTSHDACSRRVHSAAARLAGLLALTAGACAVAAGCGSAEAREGRPRAVLAAARAERDDEAVAERRSVIDRNLARIKAEYDEYTAGRAPAPPVVDLLVISGGADWGAFGAGILKGWGKVPAGPMRRPEFDAVTGVSTGALIAPFAFLGDEASIDEVVRLYRNPQKTWVKPRGLFAFLSGAESYAEIPGLEQEMRRALDMRRIWMLVEAGSTGRLLAVNTTDVDFGDMHAWDVVEEARMALEAGKPQRVHQVLLASASMPGLFPPRKIDGRLYVDGAVTGNILYGGRAPDEDGFLTAWACAYPDAPPPKIRYWVIFNNQLRFPPETVQPKWSKVLVRSSVIATQSATVNAIRHLFALAEVSKLKRGADVEVRYVTIPDAWAPSEPGAFKRKVMNELADIGERMGADPSSWRTQPP
jgi:patatin-like phospholipase